MKNESVTNMPKEELKIRNPTIPHLGPLNIYSFLLDGEQTIYSLSLILF